MLSSMMTCMMLFSCSFTLSVQSMMVSLTSLDNDVYMFLNWKWRGLIYPSLNPFLDSKSLLLFPFSAQKRYIEGGGVEGGCPIIMHSTVHKVPNFLILTCVGSWSWGGSRCCCNCCCHVVPRKPGSALTAHPVNMV